MNLFYDVILIALILIFLDTDITLDVAMRKHFFISFGIPRKSCLSLQRRGILMTNTIRMKQNNEKFPLKNLSIIKTCFLGTTCVMICLVCSNLQPHNSVSPVRCERVNLYAVIIALLFQWYFTLYISWESSSVDSASAIWVNSGVKSNSSSRFSWNSEAYASKFQKNREDAFPSLQVYLR